MNDTPFDRGVKTKSNLNAKPVPWPLATIGGAIAAASASWLLFASFAVVGWVADPDESISSALRFGTEIWLLANGGQVVLGNMEISLVPMGLTAVILALAVGTANYAVQQAKEARLFHLTTAGRIAILFTISYIICVLLGTVAANQIAGLGRSLMGSLIIAGIASGYTVIKELPSATSQLPPWIRVIPKAIFSGLLVVTLGAAIALTTAVVLAQDKIVAVHNSLEPGLVGTFLLLLLQLAYLPNFLIWAGAWVLGAGFSIGKGTVIAPTLTDAGMVPALPILAAVPTGDSGGWSGLLWLSFGVLAGGLAAFIVLRRKPYAGFGETVLIGALVGVACGLVIVILGAFSSGSVGINRMSYLGPRLLALLIQAPALLGISGAMVGIFSALFSSSKHRLAKPDLG